jgi:hypothetical protein
MVDDPRSECIRRTNDMSREAGQSRSCSTASRLVHAYQREAEGDEGIVNTALRDQLLAMIAEDERVRAELAADGSLYRSTARSSIGMTEAR